MSEFNNTAHEIGWDDEISSDSGQYILLEEGDYNFTVTAFERGRFPGSTKIPPCNKATLTLAVDTVEGTASVRYDLILCRAWRGKFRNFSGQLGRRNMAKSSVHSGML